MSKPDTVEFARQVLYNLAAISAEVRQTNLMLAEVLAHLKNRPVEEYRDYWKEHTEKLTEALYSNALEEAKIDPPDEDEPPPFQNRGANPRG